MCISVSDRYFCVKTVLNCGKVTSQIRKGCEYLVKVHYLYSSDCEFIIIKPSTFFMYSVHCDFWRIIPFRASKLSVLSPTKVVFSYFFCLDNYTNLLYFVPKYKCWVISGYFSFHPVHSVTHSFIVCSSYTMIYTIFFFSVRARCWVERVFSQVQIQPLLIGIFFQNGNMFEHLYKNQHLLSQEYI